MPMGSWISQAQISAFSLDKQISCVTDVLRMEPPTGSFFDEPVSLADDQGPSAFGHTIFLFRS